MCRRQVNVKSQISILMFLCTSHKTTKVQTRNMKENKKIINLWHKTCTQYVSRVLTICCALCVVIVSEYNARINLFGHKFSQQLFHIASHSVEHKWKVFFYASSCRLWWRKKNMQKISLAFTRLFHQHSSFLFLTLLFSNIHIDSVTFIAFRE